MHWIQDVRYIILNAHGKNPGFEMEYAKAYECWRLAWTKFRNEVGVTDKLNSDGFRLADEIGAIFYGEDCVAIHCFTYGNWENGPYQDLSCFNGWTEKALNTFKNFSQTNSLVCTQFAVHPNYTGKNQITHWKEINSLYIFTRFQCSKADIMCAHINLTRKMQDVVGESFGGTVLEPLIKFNYYGDIQDSQLVAYKKENFDKVKKEKDIEFLCAQLWSKCLHVSDFPVLNKKHETRKAA